MIKQKETNGVFLYKKKINIILRQTQSIMITI